MQILLVEVKIITGHMKSPASVHVTQYDRCEDITKYMCISDTRRYFSSPVKVSTCIILFSDRQTSKWSQSKQTPFFKWRRTLITVKEKQV